MSGDETEELIALKTRKHELVKLVEKLQGRLGEKRLYDDKQRMLGPIEFHQERAKTQRQLAKVSDDLREVKLKIEIIGDRHHQARYRGSIKTNHLLKEILRVRDLCRGNADDPSRTPAAKHVYGEIARSIDQAIERARELEQ